MNQDVERIEVYLDESKEPLQVLTSPPFKVKLDTQQIADGPHTLRVVTLFKGGKVEKNEIEFEVDNLPSPFVDGIDDGQQVRGLAEFEVLPGNYKEPADKGRLTVTLAALSSIVVLGLIWAFFAFSNSSKSIVAANAAGGGEEKAAVSAPNVDHGKELYASKCASCHGDKGAGAFGPALAGNPLLDNAEGFDKVTKEGRGSMPPFTDLSEQDLADIRGYLAQLGGAAKAEPAKPAAQAAASGGDAAAGEKIYAAQCAGCHGADGEGGFGPALAGAAIVKDAAKFDEVVKKGRGSMPPYATLSDDDLANLRAFLAAK